jgi:hypothetical protein
MSSNGKWVNPAPSTTPRELQPVFQSLSSYIGGVQPYIPTLTASTTAPTYAGGGVEGEFQLTGAWCSGAGYVLFPASGSTAGTGIIYVSLPVPVANFVVSVRKRIGAGFWFDASAPNVYYFQLHSYPGLPSGVAEMYFDTPTAGGVEHALAGTDGLANNDQLSFDFRYRVEL